MSKPRYYWSMFPAVESEHRRHIAEIEVAVDRLIERHTIGGVPKELTSILKSINLFEDKFNRKKAELEKTHLMIKDRALKQQRFNQYIELKKEFDPE